MLILSADKKLFPFYRKLLIFLMLLATELVSAIAAANAFSFDKPSKFDNLWANSPLKRFYKNKNGKQRGNWGEFLFKNQCTQYGAQVEAPLSTEYDVIIEGYRIEVKTNGSNYSEDAKIKINWAQIRPGQKYDFMAGMVIAPDGIRVFLIPHAVLKAKIAEGVIKNQHGGIFAKSGTYILNSFQSWIKEYETTFSGLVETLQQTRLVAA